MSKKMTFNQLAKEKNEALQNALAGIDKDYGKGTIQVMSSDPDKTHPHLSTGILSLDIALGIGGLPKGRIIEIYGNESSSKTSLCLNIVAEAQKAGGICAFIDAEHALDPKWAANIGVNIDELIVSQPDSAEDALSIAERLVQSNALSVIVVDSVAALAPKAEIEGDMEDQQMGLLARILGKNCRRITSMVSKTNTIIIFINQNRATMNTGGFGGSKNTQPGGKALKYTASVRMELARITTHSKGDEAYGIRVKAKIVKNKVAPPFTETEFDLIFDGGYSKENSIIDEAEKRKIIKKAGTWYSYGETRLGQGKENARQFLLANPELTQEIKNKVLDTLKPKSNRVVVDPEVSNDNEDTLQEETAGGEEE